MFNAVETNNLFEIVKKYSKIIEYKKTDSNQKQTDQTELQTPQSGPATLRKKITTPSWTGARVNKETSWEKLANVKS